MYTNTDATVYRFVSGAYVRRYIPAVFWNEVKHSNAVKSGMTVTDSAQVFIPYDEANPLELTVGKDIFVKGSVPFEFNNATQAAQAASLKSLRDDYGNVLTVSAADAKLFGSKEMRHYEVSLK